MAIDSLSRRRILIGSAGTGTAFAACAALRRYWGDSIELSVMDINPPQLVTSSLLADHYFEVEPFRSARFESQLLGILAKQAVEFYLPLFPLEIRLAAELKHQQRLPAHTQVVGPGWEACEVVNDKYHTATWLKKHGLPTPRTCLEIPDFDAPNYCIKPRMGSGSIGVRLLSKEELNELCRSGPLPADLSDGVVIQEQCSGPELTVDVFIGREPEQSRVLCRERLEVKSGVSTKVRIFEDATLTELAVRLGTSLNHVGAFCFQVMRNEQGWCVSDINARPGAATATCTVTGNDFFGAMFANAFGESTESFFQPLVAPVYVTRQYGEFLMMRNDETSVSGL